MPHSNQWLIPSCALGLVAILGASLPATTPLVTSGPLNAGDTAWMLTATALVLFMTPGLAFFYGGMVRKQNVISTMFQSFISMALVSVL